MSVFRALIQSLLPSFITAAFIRTVIVTLIGPTMSLIWGFPRVTPHLGDILRLLCTCVCFTDEKVERPNGVIRICQGIQEADGRVCLLTWV